MSIKAIVFDYGGVIAGTPSSVFNEIICNTLGILEEKFLTEYFKINHRLNKEGISRKQLLSDLLIILGKEDKHDELMSQLDTFYEKDDEINAQVLTLVQALRAAGYKTAILSNNTIENARKIHAAQFSEYFDAIIISIEVGSMKPEPEIFQKLFAALQVKPEETIFVDDTTKSLSTATDIGYHPILFTDYASLLVELRELGVIINSNIIK